MDTETATDVSAETWARWWVILNCGIWPDDLPGKPHKGDVHSATRGAWTVVNLVADEALVARFWARRDSLLVPYRDQFSS